MLLSESPTSVIGQIPRKAERSQTRSIDVTTKKIHSSPVIVMTIIKRVADKKGNDTKLTPKGSEEDVNCKAMQCELGNMPTSSPKMPSSQSSLTTLFT